MIYTIGYQGMKSPVELAKAMERFSITHLLDVRSKPYSRNRDFSKGRIEDILRESVVYEWVGDRLGGFNGPVAAGELRWLAEYAVDKVVCLMCMEKDPTQCHRYNDIGKRICAGFDLPVLHIVINNDVMTTIGYDGL